MKIISSKEMAKIEAKAVLQGSTEKDFMEEAGRQIALIAHAYIERNDLIKHVVLLCGKGNNAGDAYAAGIYLLNMGYSVDALQLMPFKECSALCQMNQTRFFNEGGLVREILSANDLALPINGLILDGIFGTGFKGEIHEPISSIIFKVNHSKLPVIAIDIPSGLNGETGEACAQTIIAKETAFLCFPKTGFFLNEGWNHIGKLRYVDFGLPFNSVKEAKADLYMIEFNIAKALMPEIKPNRNKYEAGFVAALAGSPGMSGAAILSCWSALSAGSGIVKLYYPEKMQNELTAAPFELIKIPYADTDHKMLIEGLNKANAVFIGPGMGHDENTVKLLKKILPKIERPCVIDADGLNILSENKIALPKETLLTPHKGEMERLLKLKTKQPLDREFLAKCEAYAKKMKVTLILKGGPTFIFFPEDPTHLNITGDPGMATAGSGDVLTGLLASLLSQKLSCEAAAIVGTFLHGIAGESAAYEKSSYCMMASDIIRHFPNAFKALS